MKPLWLLLLAPALALAATTVTDVPGTHDLYKGSKKLGAYLTHVDCVNAAKALNVTAAYECRNTAKVTVTITATPPPMMHAGLYVDPTSIPAPQAGVADDRVTNSGIFPARSAEYPLGQFRTVCYFSHYGYDDPIVHPGMVDSSHLHVFFGNGSTDANSTLASLKLGTSTCRGGTINRTAYWQPAVLDVRNNKAVPARTSILYYKVATYADATRVVPFPEGMKIVAGDPLASAPVQYGPARFSCSGNAVGNDNTFPYVPDPKGPHTFPSLVDCPVGNEIHAEVLFPSCWDGVNLDSSDHRSHMAYIAVTSTSAACPATHPITVPQITVKVIYPIRPGDDPAYWRVASDVYNSTLPGGYSLHADWFNAWKPDIMATWNTKCLVAGNDCQAHMLGDGRTMDEFGGN